MLCGEASTHDRVFASPVSEQKRRVFMDIRNEIKAHIVREGMTMSEVVELADVLGYDIIWKKRK